MPVMPEAASAGMSADDVGGDGGFQADAPLKQQGIGGVECAR